MGGEVPNKLRLSLITRGLSRVILKLIGKFINGLEYHMGQATRG